MYVSYVITVICIFMFYLNKCLQNVFKFNVEAYKQVYLTQGLISLVFPEIRLSASITVDL